MPFNNDHQTFKPIFQTVRYGDGQHFHLSQQNQAMSSNIRSLNTTEPLRITTAQFICLDSLQLKELPSNIIFVEEFAEPSLPAQPSFHSGQQGQFLSNEPWFYFTPDIDQSF
jgi:hypothetical protein